MNLIKWNSFGIPIAIYLIIVFLFCHLKFFIKSVLNHLNDIVIPEGLGVKIVLLMKDTVIEIVQAMESSWLNIFQLVA